MYNLRDKELLALKNRHALTGNVLKGKNAAMKQKVMQKIMNIHWLIISICRLGTKGGHSQQTSGKADVNNINERTGTASFTGGIEECYKK